MSDPVDPPPQDAVIEFYKQHVDRTMLEQNRRRTPHERLEAMIAMLDLVEELRRGMAAGRGGGG